MAAQLGRAKGLYPLNGWPIPTIAVCEPSNRSLGQLHCITAAARIITYLVNYVTYLGTGSMYKVIKLIGTLDACGTLANVTFVSGLDRCVRSEGPV